MCLRRLQRPAVTVTKAEDEPLGGLEEEWLEEEWSEEPAVCLQVHSERERSTERVSSRVSSRVRGGARIAVTSLLSLSVSFLIYI